jgi:anti-sigma regulatory factor (Ser/Thr protein kinase)
MTAERLFAPTPESVAASRRFVLDHVRQLPTSTRDQLALIVSELATNAVIHAVTPFTIAMNLREDALRLEVSDRSSLEATPATEPPPPDQPHGRGLMIVGHMAGQLGAEWGVTGNGAASGKTIWLNIPLGTSAAPSPPGIESTPPRRV